MSTDSNRTVLVTGASGLLGRHLTRSLSAKGCKVRALYHSHPPQAELKNLPGVEWMQCDLLDIYDVEAAMEGMDDVYHCAAIVSYDPAMHARMLHFNAESTANVVDQALTSGVRKLVYVSSVAALGGKVQGKEITEEEEWEEEGHNSAYGTAKYMAEIEVWRAIGEGLDAVIVNPAIILGPGDWSEGSAHLMQVVYKEFPFYTGGTTGWVDVRDVVSIMQQLMESDIIAERFILSAGNYAFRDVFTQMAQALGKKPPHIAAGSVATNMVWRLSAVKSRLTCSKPFITKETARSAQTHTLYNNTKLFRFLPGFQYTPLKATIQYMAQFFMKELEEGN